LIPRERGRPRRADPQEECSKTSLHARWAGQKALGRSPVECHTHTSQTNCRGRAIAQNASSEGSGLACARVVEITQRKVPTTWMSVSGVQQQQQKSSCPTICKKGVCCVMAQLEHGDRHGAGRAARSPCTGGGARLPSSAVAHPPHSVTATAARRREASAIFALHFLHIHIDK
jgi:hypothetical protein